MASHFWEPRGLVSAWAAIERASRFRVPRRSRSRRSKSGKAVSLTERATALPVAERAKLAEKRAETRRNERARRWRLARIGQLGFGG